MRQGVFYGYTRTEENTTEKGGIAIKAPFILAYNLSPEREKEILKLASLHKLRLQIIPKEEHGQLLSALIGLDEKQIAPENDTFDDEMLVFCFVSGEVLNAFLSSFTRYRVERVRLKAMLTDTNQHWNGVQLHKELSAEDAWFKAHQAPKHEQ